MGEALYAQLGEDRPDIAHRTYAPVGSHRDLLAYLVRRLLENGANSSFVALAADDRGAGIAIAAASGRHHRQRRQCRASEHSAAGATSIGRSGKIRAASNSASARRWSSSLRRSPPHNTAATGSIARSTTEARPMPAIAAARRRLQGTGAERRPQTRAAALEKAADLLEQRARAFHRAAASARAARRSTTRSRKSARPWISAATMRRRGAKLFGDGEAMPGPTGESNVLVPARPWRLRRDLAVEFSAGDLPGPGHGGADGGQRGRCKAGRADAADCG